MDVLRAWALLDVAVSLVEATAKYEVLGWVMPGAGGCPKTLGMLLQDIQRLQGEVLRLMDDGVLDTTVEPHLLQQFLSLSGTLADRDNKERIAQYMVTLLLRVLASCLRAEAVGYQETTSLLMQQVLVHYLDPTVVRAYVLACAEVLKGRASIIHLNE